jgi:hypothetical protein
MISMPYLLLADLLVHTLLVASKSLSWRKLFVTLWTPPIVVPYFSVLAQISCSNPMFHQHYASKHTLHFLVRQVELATTCGFCETCKFLWTQCSIMHFWCLLLHTSTHMHKTLYTPPPPLPHTNTKSEKWCMNYKRSRLQARMNFNTKVKEGFKKSLF